MQVIDGALARRHGSSAPTPLMEAYAHFRLDRQAIPCSKATMLTYEYTLGAFLRWVAREHPEVRRFEDLDVVVVCQYRAEMAERPGLHGKTLTPDTLSGADRSMRTLFRWAVAEAIRSRRESCRCQRSECRGRSQRCSTSTSCGRSSPRATRSDHERRWRCESWSAPACGGPN